MARAQQEDPKLQDAQDSSLQLRAVHLPMVDATLLCDMNTGTSRPCALQPFRRAVFDALHSLSHPGICVTQRLVTARYVWPRINADVRKCPCLQCQRTKVQQHIVTGTFTPPDVRFDHVHIDLVGPCPLSGVLLPPNLCGQIHSLAQGHSTPGHQSTHGCAGFCLRLGRTFQYPLHHHH